MTNFIVPVQSVYKSEIPLFQDKEGALWSYKGHKILKRNRNREIEDSFPIKCGIKMGFLAKFQLFRRVLRLEVNNLKITKNKDVVAVAKGAILLKKREDQVFKKVFNIEKGSKPLNLCKDDSGALFWGEYFSNPNREEVRIFGSEDGANWKSYYVFPSNTIRHVHGIFWDRFRKGLWVLTGDSDKESGVWFTDNQFKTLSKVFSGSQKARAVSIIPLKSGLIIPMDSPLETNYIQFFDLTERTIQNLAQIPSSAFNSYDSKNLKLISTVVEPSEINDTKSASIYASTNSQQWIRIANLEQGYLSSLSYKYFRYPEIIFMPSEMEDEITEINIYLRGTKKYNNCWLTINIEDIKNFMEGDNVIKTLKK